MKFPPLNLTALLLAGFLLGLCVSERTVAHAGDVSDEDDSYQQVLDGLRERSERVNSGFQSLRRLDSVVQITEGMDASGTASTLTLEVMEGDRMAQEMFRRYHVPDQESKLRRREIVTRDGRELHKWNDWNEGFIYTNTGVEGAFAGARPVKMISQFIMDHQNYPYPVGMELYEYLDPDFRFPDTMSDSERHEVGESILNIEDPVERLREAERLNRMELTRLEDGRFQIAIHPFDPPGVEPVYYMEYTVHDDGAIDRIRRVSYADPNQLRMEVRVHEYKELDGLRVPSRWTSKGCLTPLEDGSCSIYQYEYELELVSAAFHESGEIPDHLFTLRDDYPVTARVHGKDFIDDNASFNPFDFDKMPSLFDELHEGGLVAALEAFDYEDYYEKQRAAIAWHLDRDHAQ